MPKIVQIDVTGEIAWVRIDNPPVNATSTAVRAGLLQAVEQVQGCALAVLSCAGTTFVAGGDMSEFDAPPQEPHLPDVVAAIENSTVPFVALLHGTVLGGGFEIAMACAWRVARPDTRFGLPEVNLGFIPGAGGTQRAPRLLGWQAAFEMACLGQMKSAQELLDLGALDMVTEDLEAAVTQFKNRAKPRLSDRTIAPMTKDEETRFKERVLTFAKGRQAPLHNLDALTWASRPFAEAQPKERALHLKLRRSEESIALRHMFFAERAVTKPAILKGVPHEKIAQVAIVGGGLMGCGIAMACLLAGLRVTLIERNAEAADSAQRSVASLLQGAVARGKISDAQLNSHLQVFRTADTYSLAAEADLAIEAVFEDLDIKRSVFENLAQTVRADTLLATNTSYLNPDEIFDGIPGPERCLGIHFFSPAHIMKLVEIVRASGTSDAALATAFTFASRLRKTPVLAGICDGFIGNRILAAYRRAAEYLLADGALPHQVDAAMRRFGMAMGPFEAQDQGGLQIALANRRRQDATRDPDERYVDIADRICALGRLGKRTGAGWYAYPDGAKTGERDPIVEDVIVSYARDAGLTRGSFTETDIQTQLLAAMANEGARIVEEGIAENAAVVDVVKCAGYGFPRWRGGPMHWADTVGHDAVTSALTTLEIASPGSWIRAGVFCHD
ncbi:MAG: FAD-dependent oxidoreductase [Pseudomonadota bacterium]